MHSLFPEISNSSRPAYHYDFIDCNGLPILIIFDDYSDEFPTPTVTNSIDRVLHDIFVKEGLLPEFIIYKDSAGEWDRVVAFMDGTFIRFQPIAPRLNTRITDDTTAIELVILSTTSISVIN
jgi:hypothetical protein